MTDQSDLFPKNFPYSEHMLKAYGILDANEHLFRPIQATDVEYLHPHVGLRRVLGPDNKFSLEIVIDDQTKKDHLRKKDVWDKINKARNELIKLQGRDLSDHFTIMLHEWLEDGYEEIEVEGTSDEFPVKSRRVRRKPTYRDLAMDVNFDALVFLIRASRSRTSDDRYKLAIHLFKSILRSFNWKETDISEYLKGYLEELKDGYCPFDIFEGPVIKDQLSNVLEYLVKVQDTAIPIERSKRTLLELHKIFLVWGDWQNAEEMLKIAYPQTYNRYKARLAARKREIISLEIT